ncbi:hypothetical protein Y032_0226g2767 [Ancylostoma ceylanicum]|nr:hypothetical protein Y032_0226g2767 [Ancylostoma ceylanicum]
MDTMSLRCGDELKPSSLPLRLYVMRFCPWCERVLLYLSRKNASVEVVNVDLVDKPTFLFSKHPEGKVPVLEHKGQNIIDSALISEYLDWIQPHTSILPSDPYLKAKQRMLSGLLEGKLPAASRAIVEEQKKHSQKSLTNAAVHDALDSAEKLLNSTFFNGEDPGFADYMTYPFLERIWIWSHEPGATDLRSDAFPSDAYPKLQRWFSKMRSRKEVARVSQPLWRHRLFNKGYIKGEPDFDAGRHSDDHNNKPRYNEHYFEATDYHNDAETNDHHRRPYDYNNDDTTNDNDNNDDHDDDSATDHYHDYDDYNDYDHYNNHDHTDDDYDDDNNNDSAAM